MKFTGERAIPHKTKKSIMNEHLERYKFAKAFIKNKKVLDIACGVGYGSEILKENAKEIYGGDISKEAIEFAKENYPGINFSVMDATKIPFKDNSFDAIVSFETIEHFKEYKQFIKEVERVLKKGGLFICSSPNKDITSPFRKKPGNPFHTQEFKVEEFKTMMENSFKNIKIFGQMPVKNDLKFKIKTIFMRTFIYKTLLFFAKKIIKYRISNNIGENYAKVLSSNDFKGDIEHTYIIVVCEKI